jgi:hypothetical protein
VRKVRDTAGRSCLHEQLAVYRQVRDDLRQRIERELLERGPVD